MTLTLLILMQHFLILQQIENVKKWLQSRKTFPAFSGNR